MDLLWTGNQNSTALIRSGGAPSIQGVPGVVTIGHNNAPVPLHFSAILPPQGNPGEGVMRNGMKRPAIRLALAIGLLATLAGCVIYPVGWGPGPGYGSGYRPNGYYYR